MAERRMFAKTIIDSDSFLDMPTSTQCLYFHLAMRADDDGFINNPRKIQRATGASNDDLKLLITKGFIIPFETGIVVIKHWKIHNYIQKDRYKPTAYIEEKSRLDVKCNKAYTLKQDAPEPSILPSPPGDEMPVETENNTACIQDGYTTETQDRLGKVRLEIDNIYCQVISHLNQKAGKNYRATTPKTKKLIHARLEEGFEPDDFFTVIDTKCAEWLGSAMEKYLRPETLFGTKFEGYLNENEGRRNGHARNGGNYGPDGQPAELVGTYL